MADAESDPHATQFLRALRQHALGPLATAERILATQRAEMRAERDAFEAFAERLETIDPVADRPVPNTSRSLGSGNPSADRIERVRTAFRGTVMSVAHYDDVYGESLDEHVAAEYGADLATGVQPASSVSFTPRYRTTLQTATDQSVRERQLFLDTLDREVTSIETARSELGELLGQLDTTTVPDWYRETFAAELDHLVYDRQETIRTHKTGSYLGDHALCEYLYEDQPWTYPVLTAVVRVREAIEL